MGLLTRYTFWRNTASIMKGLVKRKSKTALKPYATSKLLVKPFEFIVSNLNVRVKKQQREQLL